MRVQEEKRQEWGGQDNSSAVYRWDKCGYEEEESKHLPEVEPGDRKAERVSFCMRNARE